MNLSQSVEADEDVGSRPPGEAGWEGAERFFAALDRAEVLIVARSVTFSERAGLHRVARIATSLGNGSLYPLLAALLIFFRVVPSPARYIVATSVSVLLSFIIYPRLKSLLARSRPCDYDPSLVRGLAPLDRYSCPSGHAMTAVAFAIPLAAASPRMIPFAAALCFVIGWSRVALGHHYVSDVLLGAAIGGAIATPVVALLLL